MDGCGWRNGVVAEGYQRRDALGVKVLSAGFRRGARAALGKWETLRTETQVMAFRGEEEDS